jgi:hypothetical protein
MAHDVFISYSTKNKVIADAVCAKLEEHRIRVWIAPRDVPSGENFANSIISAIDSCKVFVLIWSEHTSEHILTEINHAFDQNIVIIPFRIQNIQPSKELVYYLGRTHWLDAIDPPLEDRIMELVSAVSAHLRIRKGKRNILTQEHPDETPRIDKHLYLDHQTQVKNPGRMGKVLLIIGSALVIIILALLLLMKSLNSSILASSTEKAIAPSLQTQPSSTAMISEPSAFPTATSSPTSEVNTPQVPSDLVGDWKSDDLHAPDNSWVIPYSIYFRFIDAQQIVFHGDGEYINNQPFDVSDIVYVNISDSTFIKKMVENPGHPEMVGTFQKWTWRFDIETVLFTMYGHMDTFDEAMSDSVVTALATAFYTK